MTTLFIIYLPKRCVCIKQTNFISKKTFLKKRQLVDGTGCVTPFPRLNICSSHFPWFLSSVHTSSQLTNSLCIQHQLTGVLKKFHFRPGYIFNSSLASGFGILQIFRFIITVPSDIPQIRRRRLSHPLF